MPPSNRRTHDQVDAAKLAFELARAGLVSQQTLAQMLEIPLVRLGTPFGQAEPLPPEPEPAAQQPYAVSPASGTNLREDRCIMLD